jgi:hypothetical protein
MTRTVVAREEIPAEVIAKFERSWGHTGGQCEAAIVDGDRIVSWHKTRKAAQSAYNRHINTVPVR